MEFSIGHKFIRRHSKHKYIETIVDIHKTISTVNNEVVKTRYVATHDFCGQPVTDYDVLQTSIAMGELIHES